MIQLFFKTSKRNIIFSILFFLIFSLSDLYSQEIDSVVIEKYENGMIKRIVPYVDSLKNGWEYYFFEEDGLLNSSTHFKMGVKDGYAYVYNYFGGIEVETEYKNGEMKRQNTYNFDGTLFISKSYVDKYNYTIKVFFPEGSCEKTVFKDGKIVEKKIYSVNNGNVLEEGSVPSGAM